MNSNHYAFAGIRDLFYAGNKISALLLQCNNIHTHLLYVIAQSGHTAPVLLHLLFHYLILVTAPVKSSAIYTAICNAFPDPICVFSK